MREAHEMEKIQVVRKVKSAHPPWLGWPCLALTTFLKVYLYHPTAGVPAHYSDAEHLPLL